MQGQALPHSSITQGLSHLASTACFNPLSGNWSGFCWRVWIEGPASALIDVRPKAFHGLKQTVTMAASRLTGYAVSTCIPRGTHKLVHINQVQVKRVGITAS